MSDAERSLSDPLPRDRHWFGPGKKRILSLDGGGVRGIVELAFLERLEALLSERAGAPVRLCDHFDLIGGVSTGAIIASGLALGLRASEIREFYTRFAPRIFHRSWSRIVGWQAKFDAEALRRELESVFGALTLGDPKFQTGLAIVLKRLDSASAWIVANNPASQFWETPTDASFVGNRHYPISALVRASTAAPSFFDPEPIAIIEGAPAGVFVDGGLTPHNDPSIALMLLVELPGHGIKWPLGADKLSLVSLGTGTFRPRLDPKTLQHKSALGLAIASLTQQIAEGQQLTMTLMSWLGAGGAPWPINSEIGDLRDFTAPFGPLFRYHRYDIRLEAAWLKEALGFVVEERELEELHKFDNPDAIARLDEFARAAAERQMRAEDFADA